MIEASVKNKTAGEGSLLWYRFGRFLCHLFILLFCKYRVFGQENLPADGGVLIASNHQSYLDPPLIGVGASRPVHFMARESLFRNAVFGRLIGSLNAFPVRQMGNDIRAVKEAIRRLKAGKVVLLFAEGTRTETGEIGQISPGFGFIAAKAGKPIVPVVIDGAFEAWPRSKKFIKPHHLIKVAFGKPIVLDSKDRPVGSGKSNREMSDELGKLVHESMINLQHELQKT